MKSLARLNTRVLPPPYQGWFYDLSKYTVRVFATLYNRLQRVGPRPDWDGSLVFACNHVSNIDAPIIGCLIGKRIHFLSKKEIFDVPVLGWMIRQYNGIPVDRDGADRTALRSAVEVLRGGGQLLLFPEGTRSRDGALGAGRPGVGMIAAMGGARCCPVFIEGSEKAMPSGAALIRPYKVRVHIGDPFPLPPRDPGLPNKEYYIVCVDEIMRRIANLRDVKTGGSPEPGPANSGSITHALEGAE